MLLPELHNYQEDYVNIAKMNHRYTPYHLNEQRRSLNTWWSLKLIWGRKMRRKRRTVAPFIGQQGAVTAFFGGKAA